MQLNEPKVVSLELNELSFEFVKKYIELGYLPAFRELLLTHPVIETQSETRFTNLEPWIQWPTVYTGLSYADHGIFHLGDVLKSDKPQIWEELEKRKITVGAISPMNARNACVAPAFFLPDPWTETVISAPAQVEVLFAAIKRVVNSNSHGRFRLTDLVTIFFNALRYSSLKSARDYLTIIWVGVRHRWARALFLDRLLADLFYYLWKSTDVGYSSIFLNAVAHIQHHHMYDSFAYSGDRRNPDWYSSSVSKAIDPLLFAYRIYDSILSEFMHLKDVRLLITTGLSQRPNPKPYSQYRFIDHKKTLEKLGIFAVEVLPRMSRDFSLMFESDKEASKAALKLELLMVDEQQLVSCDIRGSELFCQIKFRGPHEAFGLIRADRQIFDLREDIVLVSIENAVHQSVGYHIDCGDHDLGCAPGSINLTELYKRAIALFPDGRADIQTELDRCREASLNFGS